MHYQCMILLQTGVTCVLVSHVGPDDVSKLHHSICGHSTEYSLAPVLSKHKTCYSTILR